MISRSLVLGAALPFLFLTSAHATMGAKTMFDRLDTDHDGTISRSEITAAAGKKYDLIASKNGGHVTLLNLGGRLSKDATQDVTKADEAKGKKADSDDVTRDQYLAQADKAFDKARSGKSVDGGSHNDGLTMRELSAPAAEDLIDMLE